LVRRQAETAAERYEELAEALLVANNLDSGDAFRELAEGGWKHFSGFPHPTLAPGPLPRWGEMYPEISDPDSVHYLMPPYYAFELARRHEGKTLDLLKQVAERSPLAEVRDAAPPLIAHQQARVAAIEARRDCYTKPPHGWWIDEDGPNWESEF
jgi:hypothetical protein